MPTSMPRLSREPSTPCFTRFTRRLRASARPVSPVSGVVASGPPKPKLSDKVVRPSLLNSASKPPAAAAVVPQNRALVLRAFWPRALFPKLSAVRRNRDFATGTVFPAFASLATFPARPSQPAIGIKPTPKDRMSSAILPPSVSGRRPPTAQSKPSVTAREVFVPNAVSMPAAPSSAIP